MACSLHYRDGRATYVISVGVSMPIAYLVTLDGCLERPGARIPAAWTTSSPLAWSGCSSPQASPVPSAGHDPETRSREPDAERVAHAFSQRFRRGARTGASPDADSVPGRRRAVRRPVAAGGEPRA